MQKYVNFLKDKKNNLKEYVRLHMIYPLSTCNLGAVVAVIK